MNTVPLPSEARPRIQRSRVAALVVIGLLAWLAVTVNDWPGARSLLFALGLGCALGLVLQRTRFCFFCHARDHIEGGDARGLLAILLALAVGTVGMHLTLGSWLAVPTPGRLPPDAHIGPVSWALGLAAVAFGLGMVISGSCISAHWYRLAEGSPTSPFALIGTAAGFVLGFNTWNGLYSWTIATGKPLWLPHHLGYSGSMALSLGVLGLLAVLLVRRRWPATRPTLPTAQTLGDWLNRLFSPHRWPYWIGGLAVGWLSTLALLRLRPLGVTAGLGAAARQWGSELGLVPERLNGLDELGGCATLLPGEWWQTPNALLVAGLVLGAFVASLLSGQFQPRRPTGSQVGRGLIGGMLLGWGAMTGLGCTVGTLLSGTMAGAVSGWVFGAKVLATVWLGLRLGLASPR